ncbi:MAG: AAA family ATPase [Bacilli bacterium]|nr:AAA family ATPase [Bacilli bacterium]
MVAENKTLEDEKKYLDTVINVLIDEIEKSEANVEIKKRGNNQFKKFIWQMRGELSDYEYNMNFNEIDTATDMINDQIKRLLIYKRALNSPYFGRIDFKRNDRVMPIYVGVTGINEDRKNYVLDWRAPISSLFYNYTIGDAKYEAPRGTIEGEITLRRQYKIENGYMQRMIESDINIDDDILQEVLANSSTDKMKNIVTTIQKEQNEIIRNNSTNHLIVQGVAGSGKTSVALHRIAYLLYQRKELNSDNVLIFSPNDVFSEYISEVLPTLGEENVLNTTFSELSKEYLRKNTKVKSFTEFIEEFYNNEIDDYTFAINKFKLSDNFKDTIDDFLKDYIENRKLENDIEMVVNNAKLIKIKKKEVNDFFYNKYKDLPIKEKINLISERICAINNISYAKCGASIRNKILAGMNIDLDAKRIYKEFLASDTYTRNFDFSPNLFNTKSSSIKYEDLMGLLYLEFELNGYPYNTNVKHIVIDEAQDYSKLQFHIIKKIFPKADFTILGDVNQTINPYYKYETLSSLQDIFGQASEYYELSKSYRSSPEIIDYANQILELSDKPSVRYQANLPVKMFTENEDFSMQIVDNITEMKENGLERIAIVTKNNTESEELLERLKPNVENVSLATDSISNDNVIIVPSYIAKGLEFDGVILYTKEDNFYNEDEKNLYYVVCTRAQHQLIIYNQPELTLEKPKVLTKTNLKR